MISLPKFFDKNPVVDSVVDNFRTKTTNPFFGTLIAVWLFHNWRLVYMLFNFDEGTKLSIKLMNISHYLDGWGFVWNLLACVGIALLVVVLTYVLLGISKYFSGFYNEKLSPWIDSLFGDENIVSKDKYLKLDKELGLLRKENGEYKESISTVEQENRDLEGKVMNFELSESKHEESLRENERYMADYKETIKDFESKEEEFDKERVEWIENFEKAKSNFSSTVTDLKSKNKVLIDELEKIQNKNLNRKEWDAPINIEKENLYKYLISNKIKIDKSKIEDLLTIFKKPNALLTLKSVKGNVPINSNEMLSALLKHGLLLDTTSILEGTIGFELSPLGEAILRYFTKKNNYALGA